MLMYAWFRCVERSSALRVQSCRPWALRARLTLQPAPTIECSARRLHRTRVVGEETRALVDAASNVYFVR